MPLASGEQTGLQFVPSEIVDGHPWGRGQRRIRSTQEWSAFWQEHTSNDRRRPPLPNISFEREEVIVVFTQIGVGSIEIGDVRADTHEFLVLVDVRIQPENNGAILPVKRPYQIVTIDRTDLPVHFSWNIASW